eukprot:1778557-Pyramimonas_sp.AAC.1
MHQNKNKQVSLRPRNPPPRAFSGQGLAALTPQLGRERRIQIAQGLGRGRRRPAQQLGRVQELAHLRGPASMPGRCARRRRAMSPLRRDRPCGTDAYHAKSKPIASRGHRNGTPSNPTRESSVPRTSQDGQQIHRWCKTPKYP